MIEAKPLLDVSGDSSVAGDLAGPFRVGLPCETKAKALAGSAVTPGEVTLVGKVTYKLRQ